MLLQIRKHAVDELSKISLNPMEKVGLGREHQVAKWFRDGLTELVSERPIRPLAELKSQLGVDMACTLLWIRDQGHQKFPEGPFSLTGITLGMLGCHFGCSVAMFSSDINCHSCARTIAVDDSNALYLAHGYDNAGISTQLPSSTKPVTSHFTINLKCVTCRNCSKCAIRLVDRYCPKCSRSISHVDYRLVARTAHTPKIDISQRILDVFGDEIASYESWDG